LLNPDVFEEIMASIDEGKLKINTLSEIFKQFQLNLGDNSIKFSDGKEGFDVKFDYEEKRWTSTVDMRSTIYKNFDWKFINIKLPNDGYIYTNNYLKNNTVDMQQVDLLEFVVQLGGFIEKLDLPDFKPNVRINYRHNEGRFECYFEDNKNCKSVTIKFEYYTSSQTVSHNLQLHKPNNLPTSYQPL
jgi:hypothetical protein